MARKRVRRRIYAQKRSRESELNLTEEKYYNDYLAPRLLDGSIIKVKFEPFKIEYAKKNQESKQKGATYLPDFYVLRADGEIEIHEVKGYCDEADIIKFKTCAAMFPEFHWFMARSSRKGFTIKEY